MRYHANKLNSIIRGLAFVAMPLILMATMASAQDFSHRAKLKFAQQSGAPSATTVFAGGRDLIDDAQWAKAEEAFAKYITSFPQEQNLDAAMFWMAYAQSKLKEFDKSKETIEKLLKAYDKSTWKEDAEMLLAQLPNGVKIDKLDPITVTVDPVEVQVRSQDLQQRIAEAKARSDERVKESQEKMQQRVKEAQDRMKERTLFRYDMDLQAADGKSSDDPCEFKIVVLQALIESDMQRGLAAATDWLKAGSTETPRCKQAALRLLARHGGKAATPTILGFAQRETDVKLRAWAISALGSTNDDSVVDPLRDFALNAPQNEISEAALFALSQHTSPRAIDALTQIALSTKPLSLRKSAISSISNRQGEPAVDALFKIYDSDQNLEIRKAVVSGFGHRRSERAGTKLLEIARGSDNLELRKAAISSISRRGGTQAVDTLLGLYDSEKNEDLKDQIIYSLGPSNDARVVHKLIEIARNPQTPIERRKRAIAWLSRSKDPEVLKLLEDLLKQ